MKRALLPLLLLFGCGKAFPQADPCAGALSALLRVKEEITPDLKDKNELRTMEDTLQAAAANCRDQPEVLYYRKLILERLLAGNETPAERKRDASDLRYVSDQVVKLKYLPSYSSPFTLPESANPEPPPAIVAHKWALVIGINKFASDSINPLHFAQKDSSDFAAYLTDPKGGRFQKDRVRLLVDEQATFAGFRSGIGWLRDNVQPADMVVIYISSHGSAPEDDPNKVSFIVMHDTKPEDVYGTSLEMVELVETLNREIKARRVVLILDTCFSGDALQGSKRIQPVLPANAPASAAFSSALAKLDIGVGRAVITASRANEESFEDVKLHNGYFTAFLIKELRQEGDKPLGEVFPKVAEQVKLAVSSAHKGKTQTPSSEFSDRAATIVIGVPEGKD